MPSCKGAMTIADLGPVDHLCFLYSTQQELLEVLSEYIESGLQRAEKVVYVRDRGESEDIVNHWDENRLDVEHYFSMGQLRIHSFTEMIMSGSVFDPDRMIRVLQNETKIALAEGWQGLRMAIEMTWALNGFPGSARLVEFESKSNRSHEHSKCLAMCLYDRRRFSPMQLLNALSNHPTVIIGGRIYDNLYYRIPPSFIRRESPATLLDDWLNELAERGRTVGA